MKKEVVTRISRAIDRLWNRSPHVWVQLLCVLLLLVSLQTVLILTVSAGMKFATAGRIFEKDQVETLAAAGAFENVDCILVLGAGLRDDGTPSSVLYDRVQTAVSVYETGEGHLLLMSGDRTGDYDEPASMTAAALDMGVSHGDVLQDKKGFSTYESLMRLKQMDGVRKIVIVTQRYHLYRAVFTAERLGFDAVGITADSPTYRCPVKNEIREILARFRDMFRVERKEPVDGEGIPVIYSKFETAE